MSAGSDDIMNYTILIAENREKLLGDDKKGEVGMIDTAINNLLEAQTLLGVQASRLEYDKGNLVTSVANEQSSESNIRDADMARENVEYTKYSILTQASQAMLAQANQNVSSVLSLLQ